MKIVIDFDDTIFDTYMFVQEIIEHFKRVGFTSDEFREIYRKSKEKMKDFDQKVVVDLFFQLKPFDKEEVVSEIDSLIERSEEFVYPDFKKFANERLRKELILLSFGSTDFQKRKIDNANIGNFFDKVHITDKDKVVYLENIYRGNPEDLIVFIDDKAVEIDKVKEKFPDVVTIKMERPRGGHVKIKSEKTDYVAKNFSDVKKIIKKISEAYESSGPINI
ncbi:MAG: HAD family hydrolase [Candidatus Paceibacterota bacterium]